VEGEPGFRKRETMILKELLQQSPAIIATGGGTIVEKENRQLLKTFGFVVYIDTPLNVQINRTIRNHYNRPLLRGGILKERVTQLYKERAPLYQEVADVTLKAPKTSYQALIRKILKNISEHHALGA